MTLLSLVEIVVIDSCVPWPRTYTFGVIVSYEKFQAEYIDQ